MKAQFSNVYTKRSPKGNVIDVFVYHVSGTDEELNNYKDAQGANYREEESTGKPLFFMTQFVGEEANVLITSNGRIVADTSAFKKAKSLANQYDFMKDHIAAAMVASLGIGSGSVRTAPVQQQATSSTSQTSVVENRDLVEGIDPFNS